MQLEKALKVQVFKKFIIINSILNKGAKNLSNKPTIHIFLNTSTYIQINDFATG